MKSKNVLVSLTSISLPLMGGLAAQMAVQIIDTIMLGRYSVDVLAAAVVATSVHFVFFTVGSGISTAVLAISSAQGQEDRPATLAAGLWLSVLFAILAFLVLFWSRAILLRLGQVEHIAAAAQDYLRLASVGLVPALLTMSLRSHATVLERPKIVLWVSLAALPVNAFLNWVFIFGNLSTPEMGIRGAALATLLAHGLSFAITLAYVHFIDKTALGGICRKNLRVQAHVLRLSWPIGISNLAELGMFTATTLIVGSLGAVSVAAHGIVIQITSAAFIVHLAMSQAATVKAGDAFARQDKIMMWRVAQAAATLSLSAVFVTTCIFVLVPEILVSLFISTKQSQYEPILRMASVVLIVAAISQLADSMQIIAMGLLRGMLDTRMPMFVVLCSYWIVAIPASLLLGTWMEYGVVGVWLGVAVGLIIADFLLWLRFFKKIVGLQGR